MQAHEHFEELGALLLIGELTAEECRELSEHLRICPNCRHVTDEFSVILDKMPVGETDVNEKTLLELQGDSYRQRFLKRAVAEGVGLSAEVMRSRSSIRKWSWLRVGLVPSLGVVAGTVIVALSLQLFRLSQKISQSSHRPFAQSVQAPASSESSRDKGVISQLEEKISALEGRADQQQSVISELRSRLNHFRLQSDSASLALSKTRDQLVETEKQASETQQALALAEADLQRARSDRQSLNAVLVDQQVKINDLASQVKEQEALAEREHQLDAVSSDIRDLMGARNLHILDVSDVDSNGRSNKSFGRVFLVEGKSLIFYAFDLGDRGNPAKVSFQAWGQLKGRETTKNLGVFYVDDHAQKRWVLKVNDPEKLRAINSVFVTVEQLGGADRPTGKRLLYAYVGNEPNHP